MQSDVFRSFCHYVDEHIFSKENMGSYVALVVDQSFVDDFCKENHTTEETLMYAVRSKLWNFSVHDHFAIKGIIAIQLFAATKRANAGGLSAKNYKSRLVQVLNWNMAALNEWQEKYQEKIWLALYQWCNKNHFLITKCEPRTGTGRYVQFPVNQALRVFTDEDLLYIAKAFVDKRLYPGEDITQYDFWKILNRHSLSRYFKTPHAFDVKNNSVSDEDYLSQIYNYYLRWTGKYKSYEGRTCTNPAISNVYAYLTEDFTLELRDENLKLLHKFSFDDINYSDIQTHFHFKREGCLLFKKDDVYDNYWQEVRYIDAANDDYSKHSEKYGIVVWFRKFMTFELQNKWKVFEILAENKNAIVYKITRRFRTEEFFTEKRAYELYGGFKIGRNTYLKGAMPILRLHKPSMVWIDGKAVEDEAICGSYFINNLSIGNHSIKLPNIKVIRINVVEVSASVLEWQDSYNKWHIKGNPSIWESEKQDDGIVGLDFSCISDADYTLNESITKRWAEAFVFGKHHKNENNIAINLIK